MKKSKVLYLSYTGMLEPLGRSQVLNYLTRLSGEYQFTLVSFEKPYDMDDKQAVAEIRSKCAENSITWQPQLYHHRPRLLVTAWDLLILLWLTLRHTLQRGVCLVHCRGYIPAIAAWLCSRITRKPFVFDMRALWPDEMVSVGRLERSSILYKTLKKMEYILLRDAHAVVSLTKAAVTYLTGLCPEIDKSKFHVITTCVDLSLFDMKKCSTRVEKEQLIVGTMGTVLSGWFQLDEMFTFYNILKERKPGAILKIVTQDNHETIRKIAEDFGISEDDLALVSCQPREVPGLVIDLDVAVLFFVPDLGKLGSAPTRVGELLAAGVPLVGNHGIGEMGELIERYGVGVTVRGGTVADLSQAVDQILDYLSTRYDPFICRKAAEDYFSVDKGTQRYHEIYKALL